MSWGVGLRTGVAVGIGNIVSFFGNRGTPTPPVTNFITTEADEPLDAENNDNLIV